MVARTQGQKACSWWCELQVIMIIAQYFAPSQFCLPLSRVLSVVIVRVHLPVLVRGAHEIENELIISCQKMVINYSRKGVSPPRGWR